MAGRLDQRPLDESRLVPAAKGEAGAVAGVKKKSRFNVQEFDAPYYKSIRFRLTAWYAAALILVIVALSLSLHTLLVRSLQNDAQSRLGNAVLELRSSISLALPPTGPQSPAGTDPLFEITPSGVDSILLSGLWFQVFDTSLEPAAVGSSGAPTTIPQNLESALGDDTVFNEDRNTVKSFEVGGVDFMVMIAPFFQRERGTGATGPLAGWIVVGEPIGSRDNIIQVVDQILRLFGVVGVALAVWGGWLMAGRALAPVERITQTADSIGNRDGTVSLSRRLEVPDTGDELSRLAHTFNRMLDRIEEAFNTQRRFVGDASHELRTPLTSVRGHVDVLLRQLRS
ncbi:MAG: HAMP domain-containing protein, partial [Chloroflexia bacterium]|nr:HAMP domain-containing protein [Chloroflexia bacterium]